MEQAEGGAEEGAATHPGGVDEVAPGAIGVLELEVDGCLHVRELGLDELGVMVAFGVVCCQDVVSFLQAVLLDQPSGAFGDEAVRFEVSGVSKKGNDA